MVTASIDPIKLREGILGFTVVRNRYIPHEPTHKEARFLMLVDVQEVLYGGAAGGGKSEALLMAALQYVDEPDYHAILFRRTFADLALPGAIMERSKEWLNGKDCTWHEMTKEWRFPSGATLTFAYMDNENHKYRYQSTEFQFIGFDELTQFTQSQYTYLFSRLRRPTGSNIPLRMRSASNPGGRGHEWVKQRFVVEGKSKGRIFIPARLADNPFLDRAAYVQSLSQLDAVTKAQLLRGDWSARQQGGKFKREWFKAPLDRVPVNLVDKVRYWDMAATAPAPGKDPDWTAGALVGIDEDGIYYIMHMVRIQGTPLDIEHLIKQVAALDGVNTPIYIEQEPGSSGVITIDHYIRKVLQGYICYGDRPTGSKEERANPVSSTAQAGNFRLIAGTWITDYLDEAESFPNGSHDDQIDAVSGAFAKLQVPEAGIELIS